jgi:hypothetical protein
MNAPYAVYLPLIVGPTAGDGVHHSALHLLNAAQQDNDVAITFVDEVSGLGVAQYTGTLRAADAGACCRRFRADLRASPAPGPQAAFKAPS